MIYNYRKQTWIFFEEKFFIQMLKSLIIFHQILKIFLEILRDLKEF
jgi:hypothetical protein